MLITRNRGIVLSATSLLVGVVLHLVWGTSDGPARLGTTVILTGAPAFGMAWRAAVFFDVKRANVIAMLPLLGFLLLVATCLTEVIDPSTFTLLAVLQVVVLVSMQMGTTLGILGIGLALAQNALKVPSVKNVARAELVAVVLLAIAPWLPWRWSAGASAVSVGVSWVVRQRKR